MPTLKTFALESQYMLTRILRFSCSTEREIDFTLSNSSKLSLFWISNFRSCKLISCWWCSYSFLFSLHRNRKKKLSLQLHESTSYQKERTKRRHGGKYQIFSATESFWSDNSASSRQSCCWWGKRDSSSSLFIAKVSACCSTRLVNGEKRFWRT